MANTYARKPLLSRPLDLVYFLFFIMHIPATVLMDCQALLPRDIVPIQLQAMITWYLNTSADPLIAGAFGLNGSPERWAWFKGFLVLELVFMLPVFFIGARAMYTDSRASYPLLLIYAATASVTTLPCLTTVLTTPVSSLALKIPSAFGGLKAGRALVSWSITEDQRLMLLSSYVPFLVIPLTMCIDMAVRVAGLVVKGQRAEAAALKGRESKSQ